MMKRQQRPPRSTSSKAAAAALEKGKRAREAELAAVLRERYGTVDEAMAELTKQER